MFGRKKSHGGKMPGGNTDPALVEAHKAQQKNNERLQAQYGIFRCIFEIQCIFLGLEEVAIMQYDEGGALPRVARRPFDIEEKDKRYEYMRNRLKDFHVMTKTDGGASMLHEAMSFIKQELEDLEEAAKESNAPPPNKAGLVGSDGVPLDTMAKEPLQEEEQKA